MRELKAFQFNRFIDAPIEFVYECLHKDKHVLKWNTMIVEHIYDGTEDEITAGSHFISKQKLGNKIYTFDTEVLIHEPPYKIAMKTTTKEGTSFTSNKLSQHHGGT